MVECIFMIIGIIVSIISIKVHFNVRSKVLSGCLIANNASIKYILRLWTPIVVMACCLIVYFLVYSRLAFYICLSVYVIAFLFFWATRKKQLIIIDTEKKQLLFQGKTATFDKTNCKHYWYQVKLIKNEVVCVCFQYGDMVISVPAKSLEELSKVEKILRPCNAVDITSHKAEKSRRVTRILLGIGILLFIICMSIELSFLGGMSSNKDLKYQQVYYEEECANRIPEIIDKLENGNICALFCEHGFANIYDEQGCYKYTYKVPKGDGNGACEMATDGKYIAIINRVQEAYIFLGDSFVERINADDAVKKYKLNYIEEYTNDDLISTIRPDSSARYDVIVELGIAISLIMLCIGRLYYARTEVEHIKKQVEKMTRGKEI